MKLFLILFISLYTSFSFSHGDHSSPGSLPFAPRGGKVAELESTSHNHSEKKMIASNTVKKEKKSDDHHDHGHDEHDHEKKEQDKHKGHGHDEKDHDDHDHEKESHDKHKGHDHDEKDHDDHDHGKEDHDKHKGHDHDEEDHASHDHETKGHVKHESHDHDEEGHAEHEHNESEKEYFIEAVYEGGLLKIYPLAFNASKPKEFEILDAKKNIAIEEVKIEFPRSKVFHSINMKLATDKKGQTYWESKIPKNKDIRFFTYFEADWHGEDRKAKVHLEKL